MLYSYSVYTLLYHHRYYTEIYNIILNKGSSTKLMGVCACRDVSLEVDKDLITLDCTIIRDYLGIANRYLIFCK